MRKETRCRHIGYSYRLTARVLLYAPFHKQDNTYHGLCYTSRGALAGTRNSSMGPPHEGSIRRPTARWANALPLSYVLLPVRLLTSCITDIKTQIVAGKEKENRKERTKWGKRNLWLLETPHYGSLTRFDPRQSTHEAGII